MNQDLRRRDRLPEEKVRRSGTDINTKETERFDLRPAGNAPSKISKSISVSSVLQAEPRIIARNARKSTLFRARALTAALRKMAGRTVSGPKSRRRDAKECAEVFRDAKIRRENLVEARDGGPTLGCPLTLLEIPIEEKSCRKSSSRRNRGVRLEVDSTGNSSGRKEVGTTKDF
uniref:Uncharacterized protein n=1 Tax=Vespula pensylvanica TaxID=30213 RepID=A0A834JWH9_VESPE|nr:hypothetical protein H0235_016779 [Vespula pensylvanica]